MGDPCRRCRGVMEVAGEDVDAGGPRPRPVQHVGPDDDVGVEGDRAEAGGASNRGGPGTAFARGSCLGVSTSSTLGERRTTGQPLTYDSFSAMRPSLTRNTSMPRTWPSAQLYRHSCTTRSPAVNDDSVSKVLTRSSKIGFHAAAIASAPT